MTGVTNVPDQNARNGIITDKNGSVVRTLKLHSLIPQYLGLLFPLPNGPVQGGGVAQYFFSRTQPTDEYFAQGRVDHRFSNRDAFFGRYTFDNGNVQRPVRDKPPIVFTAERSRNQYVFAVAAQYRARKLQPLDVRGRQPAHGRGSSSALVGARHSVRILHHPGARDRNGRRLPHSARRPPEQLPMA